MLAIAKAQYQPRDTETDATTSATLAHLASSYESDLDEEYHSNYSEQKPINFTDITAMPSSVRTGFPPTTMLELQANFLQAGGKSATGNPLQKAIVENDFEAFVRTLDLYVLAGMVIRPESGAYNLAVTLDRPEMLDEFIRRSGVGVSIPSDAAKGREADSKVSQKRVYLGLKVGGNRRVDIANHKETTSKTRTYDYDLLRSAIRSGATKVIDYLAGPRPTAAFKHYAETHDDEIAQYLKSIHNFDADLPELLGWKPDESNESPLLCAVIANRLDVLKQMFALKPRLMEESVDLRCDRSPLSSLLWC